GIDIALKVAVSSPYLLRRTIMHRPHCIGADGIGRSHSGDSEICYLYLSIRRNDNVLGLNIPVYNVSIMSSLQTHGNLNGNTGSFLYSQPSFFGNILLQSNAFYQLHNNIVNALILPYVKNVYYIGMGKPCRCLSFPLKFTDKICICAELRL